MSTRIIYIFTACNRNISNISIASYSYFFNYAFSRSCTACCCIDFEYSFTAFSFLIYCNGRTSFSFYQTIVIEFNIYIGIFTICIIFGHRCNTVAIAFNVQLTIVCKEVSRYFVSTNCCCISIRTNTYTNVFQLCYVYSISIFVTSCYVNDLTFLNVVTNGNGTSLSTNIPLIAICINCRLICTITNLCAIYEFTIKANIFIVACFTSYFRTSTKCYTTLYTVNLSCSTYSCCIISTSTSYSSTETDSLGTNILIALYISTSANRNTFTSLNIRTMTPYEAIRCFRTRTRT